jgi:AraC-like DNA-binding protein
MRQYGATDKVCRLIELTAFDTIDTFDAHAGPCGKLFQRTVKFMPKSLTIDASPVLGHFRKLKEYGVSTEVIEETLGISHAELQIVDARVPFLNNMRMIEKGIALIGPNTALRLGAAVSLERMGVCGHIFKNCQNIAEVVDQFIRYQRLLYAVSSFRVTKTGHQVMLTHTIENSMFRMYNRLTVELAFSSIVSAIRNLIEDEVNPLEVRFTYDQPDYVTEYKSILRAPLLFNQKEDSIVFSSRQFHKSIPKSHVYVKNILMQHANGLLQDLKEGTNLKDEVKKLVILNLPKGNVDIEMVSKQLNMSRWTLTRRLKKEGTTFHKFLTELKKELSLHYLQNEKLSIGEIAFLLGYSEISTFRRAFKDWTGKNPYGYRREMPS